MQPRINKPLKNVECRINWNIEDFEDLRLFAEVFNLADRIVLSDTIFNAKRMDLIEEFDLGGRRVISQRDYVRFLDSARSEKRDLDFHPSTINSLKINSPPVLDMGTMLGVLGIAWAILATDFDVMGRNLNSMRHFFENQAFSAQLKILSAADGELEKIERLIVKYRRHIELLRSEIERKRNKPK